MRRFDGWLVLAVLGAVSATAAAQPAEEPASGATEEATAGTAEEAATGTTAATGEPGASATPTEAAPGDVVAPFTGASISEDAAPRPPTEPEVRHQANPFVRSGQGQRVLDRESPAATQVSASGEDEGAPVPSAPLPEEGDVAAAQVRPGSGAGAAADAGDWLARLEEVSEDTPLVQLVAGPLVLAPVGMFQLLGVPWQGEAARLAAGDLVNEEGFRFRRARIGLLGWGPWNLSLEVLAEFDEHGAELEDLNLSWAPYDALVLSAGSSKTPFSASLLTPAMFQTFLDRPWGVDGETDDGQQVGIAPGRMLGAWISGRWSVLGWKAGVYNGNPDYFTGNNTSGMLYGGRVEVYPLGDLPEGQLQVEGGEPRLRIGAAYYFNDDAAGNTHAAEGDAKFRWLGLTVEGEFLWSTFALAADPSRPPDTAGDIDRMAYYVQAGYLLYEDWVDLAVRFDSFELNDGIDDFNDRWSIGAVATLFLLRNRIKVQLEYMHHQEWAGPQVPNDHVALQLQGRF
ncbi:MAG: hypothetical protein JXB32_12065 [Deltaproteobacteria bacterium]|nr:hypothetical protein [Deltaproteobacteria bacterium]